MNKIVLLFIGFSFYSCSSNDTQEINKDSVVVTKQQQPKKAASKQSFKGKVSPTTATVPSKKRKKTTTKERKKQRTPKKRTIVLEEEMKPYLKMPKQTKAYQNKVSKEVDFFVDHIDGIVKLTKDQKLTIRQLSTKNIAIKMKLLEDRSKLMADPNRDKGKVRTISKAIAYQHQEERKYLKEVLTADQFNLYVEFQNKKKKDRLNKLKKK